ncbi:hypothetical protein FPV16_09785 [Methylobacterium sp. W2]|uniref:HK97-gp10 family putative phage morphogenesis protein n=1 Tax=Methylobacterium sp. W2 TaxID=2598107 RepID=UPI001D0C9F42|nr:HK97-gp10 family putative phage morphogenesis protein [Methylobacterium sp. W2]MCC0806505.1 hypothetical protein [Methylobacterium sp. W2]
MISMGFEGLSTLILSSTRKARLRKRVVDHLEAVAQPVADEIRAGAPERSGTLRDSVRVERDEKNLKVTISAGGTPETQRPSANGTTYDEAVLTEFGTVHQPAHPFFFPPIEQHQRDFERAGSDAVTGAMEGDE